MLKMRLQRVGRKHEPTFRLVLTDSKNSTKSGRFAEVLGAYDPRKSIDSFNADRIKHWLSQGAAVTGSVNNLLIKHGIIRGKKAHVGADFKAPVVEEAAPEAPAEEVAAEAPAEAAPEVPAEAPAPEAAVEAVQEIAPEAPVAETPALEAEAAASPENPSA